MQAPKIAAERIVFAVGGVGPFFVWGGGIHGRSTFFFS